MRVSTLVVSTYYVTLFESLCEGVGSGTFIGECRKEEVIITDGDILAM